MLGLYFEGHTIPQKKKNVGPPHWFQGQCVCVLLQSSSVGSAGSFGGLPAEGPEGRLWRLPPEPAEQKSTGAPAAVPALLEEDLLTSWRSTCRPPGGRPPAPPPCGIQSTDHVVAGHPWIQMCVRHWSRINVSSDEVESFEASTTCHFVAAWFCTFPLFQQELGDECWTMTGAACFISVSPLGGSDSWSWWK